MKNNNDLEELMKNATEKVDETTDKNVHNEKSSNKTKKVVLLTLIGLVLLGGVFVSAGILMNKPQDFENKTKNPNWIEKTDTPETVENKNEWNFDHPIELKEWAIMPYNKNSFWTESNVDEVLLEAQNNSSFYSSVSWIHSGLPSPYENLESKVYTNNLSERYLEDGSENPDFSYAVSEDYQKAYITYTERLLNPVFGNWSVAQYNPGSESVINAKRNYEFNSLKDMFSSEWWTSNIQESKDYSKLPLFAEWETGSWKNYNLKERENPKEAIFYGQVEFDEGEYLTAETIGNDEENMPIIKIDSPVKFYALQKDGEMIRKTGTLSLTLKSNYNSTNENDRIVIDKAGLIIK